MLHLGETTYRSPEHETAMSITVASAVLASRTASDVEAVVRRNHASALIGGMAGSTRARFARVPDRSVAGYLRLPVRVPGGIAGLDSRDRALKLGLAQSYPKSLARLDALAGQIVRSSEHFPGTEQLVRDLITLPTHSRVTEAERGEIVALLR